MKRIPAICLVLFLIPGYALAQGSDTWDWKIAPYLWTVGIDGQLSIGEINQDLDVSFSDILSDFDVGGSLYGEIGRGQHAFHIDYTYLRLKPDDTALPTPPFPMDSTLSTKMTINIFEPAYHLRLNEAQTIDFVVGARYLDIELRMTPNVTGPSLPVTPPVEPPFPGSPVEVGPSWWDYFLGIKTNHQISENWDFGFYGTIGAGGSEQPWTLQAVFGRRFSNDNRLGLGFRIWSIDYTDVEGIQNQVTTIDTRFYGFLIGYEFN
ncbi:MAG: hypothetical protein KJO33_03255 [Gammaproteobacteria bacterium]|nr:hypothetical protein [Gammaproteobacteria bacterium]NNK33297.1 hypothetical protein [Xanthomonadales bacterium]